MSILACAYASGYQGGQARYRWVVAALSLALPYVACILYWGVRCKRVVELSGVEGGPAVALTFAFAEVLRREV